MSCQVNQVVNKYKNLMIESGKLEHIVDVDWLMMWVLKCNRSGYILKLNDALSTEHYKIFESCMQRRLSGEPLQYILNHQSFYGYDFYVDDRVLIPRFETEELVEKASKIIMTNGYKRIMDLCSGSGCIGITLLKECPEVVCTFVDISKDALAVAEMNCKSLDVYSRSSLIESNLFSAIKEKDYEVIISNPPYIEREEVLKLEEEIRMKEPNLALDGGADGLDFYRVIIKDAKKYLKNDGYLMFEIGYNQKDSVIELMEAAGYREVVGYKDLSGNDRMVIGRI